MNHDTKNLHEQPQSSQGDTVTMRELSREMQLKWVEKLFSRLMALYGKQFSAMWEDADQQEVKEVWADKLGGFNAFQIGGALTACDSRAFPPNLPEFIAIARRVSVPSKPSLRYDLTPAQAMENKAKIEAAAKNLTLRTDHKRWAHRIKEREVKGDRSLTALQVRFANEALANEMH